MGSDSGRFRIKNKSCSRLGYTIPTVNPSGRASSLQCKRISREIHRIISWAGQGGRVQGTYRPILEIIRFRIIIKRGKCRRRSTILTIDIISMVEGYISCSPLVGKIKSEKNCIVRKGVPPRCLRFTGNRNDIRFRIKKTQIKFTGCIFKSRICQHCLIKIYKKRSCSNVIKIPYPYRECYPFSGTSLNMRYYGYCGYTLFNEGDRTIEIVICLRLVIEPAEVREVGIIARFQGNIM